MKTVLLSFIVPFLVDKPRSSVLNLGIKIVYYRFFRTVQYFGTKQHIWYFNYYHESSVLTTPPILLSFSILCMGHDISETFITDYFVLLFIVIIVNSFHMDVNRTTSHWWPLEKTGRLYVLSVIHYYLWFFSLFTLEYFSHLQDVHLFISSFPKYPSFLPTLSSHSWGMLFGTSPSWLSLEWFLLWFCLRTTLSLRVLFYFTVYEDFSFHCILSKTLSRAVFFHPTDLRNNQSDRPSVNLRLNRVTFP